MMRLFAKLRLWVACFIFEDQVLAIEDLWFANASALRHLATYTSANNTTHTKSTICQYAAAVSTPT